MPVRSATPSRILVSAAILSAIVVALRGRPSSGYIHSANEALLIGDGWCS